jgi:hypothetical protein
VTQRIRRSVRLALLALLLLGAVYAARVALWRPLTVEAGGPDDGYSRVSGVVHVHTTLSDGGGTPEEVIAAARAAGLGFVVITDHNNVDAKAFEGHHAGVLVLVGSEISTNAGHVLGLGIPDPAYRFSGDGSDALDDVRALGGVAFAAHPASPAEAFQWTGWDLPGPWGLELLNGDSQWRAAGVARLARTAALYGLNRRYALLTSLSEPREVLARWDALLRERNVSGIAGADAHSRVPVRKQTAVRFPAYDALFGLVRNHVLLEAPLGGDAARDAAAVLDALARGRSYVALDALAPADGFSFVAEREGRRWTMGDSVEPAPGLKLTASGALPRGARLRLLRDGRVLAENEGALTLDRVEPGVYRVEVLLRGWTLPWVLSNPIYVFDPQTTASRAERAAWPVEQPPPAAAAVLDSFDDPHSSFVGGAVPASSMAPGILDPRAGRDGRGAARLAFRLEAPTEAQPHPFCALVDWTHRDLRGRSGLLLSIRADGVYRLWVQVRDENPASADEGTEWWFASIRTDTAWRRLAVPFSRLRSINPASDGRLDLDEVRAIVFVVDKGALKPGTQGTIWIDDLAVY